MGLLFKPFRALGYITGDVPFAVQRRGKETFVTVSVGRSWQVYKSDKITLAFVGPELPGDILALAVYKDLTFAAVSNKIYEAKRLHSSGIYNGHESQILQLLVLGDTLLSLGSDHTLCVWEVGSYSEPMKKIKFNDSPSCMAHPSTYLNKVVIGFSTGVIELWNFVAGKLLYTFKIGTNKRVCCIQSSPALDVIGIGMSDGRVILHNIKFDKEVAAFTNASGVGTKASLYLNNSKPDVLNELEMTNASPCTAIAFKTGAGTPLMAVGGIAGVITVWDLERRQLQTLIRDAHDGPVLNLYFFVGEPRLLSASADNSMKQFLFDAPDGSGRLLKFRAGHSSPPNVVRHYGDGTRLLSGGTDRAFRLFSIMQDHQSRELSQGHIKSRAKKLKVRERDWANIITAHYDDTSAYTWRLQNFARGEHVLRPISNRIRRHESLMALPTPVTAVAISCCGNFGLVGSSDGRIDRYNLQSGFHRGSFLRKNTAGSSSDTKVAHDLSVTGLGSDTSNKFLVSASLDGYVRIWNFRHQHLAAEINVNNPITKMALHPASTLVAIAVADHTLFIYDIETYALVRQFKGHEDDITDLSFSSDGKWLMSSSKDGTFRVWDVPSSCILQVLKLDDHITSFSLSPSLEMLATTHVGKNGWYSIDVLPQSLDLVFARCLSLGQSDDICWSSSNHTVRQAYSLLLATDIDADDINLDRFDIREGVEDSNFSDSYYNSRLLSGAPAPIQPSFITLSQLPKSQWHNLMHLDAIRERNKPLSPPKKLEAAPFFIPSIASVSGNPVFDVNLPDKINQGHLPGWGNLSDEGDSSISLAVCSTDDSPADDKLADKTCVLKNAVNSNYEDSILAVKLKLAFKDHNFHPIIKLLRDMSPLEVEAALQDMTVMGIESDETKIESMRQFMVMMAQELENGSGFEHLQAILRVFLNIHSQTISESCCLRDMAVELEATITQAWTRLEDKLNSVKCLTNFLVEKAYQ